MSLTSPITLHRLSLNWPTGERVLSHLEGTFPSGLTGLIGANGSGKSTLLKLITGELIPTEGHVETSATVGYLAQTLTLDRQKTIAELLGVAEIYRGLKAIEEGSVDPADFDAVGEHWDIEARLAVELAPFGISSPDLGRPIGTLSGGEAMLLAVVGLRLAQHPITVLDEPTNNLDAPSRDLLYQLISSWKGSLVVVSHDKNLLELMEHTMELYAGKLRLFGGPYSEYLEQLETEQLAAEQAAKTADAAFKVEKRQRVEAETKLARAKRKGRAEQLSGGLPRILANHLRQKSEANAGKMRSNLDGKVDDARAHLGHAESQVRQVEHINLDLTDPQLPSGRQIADIYSGSTTHRVQGPERVGLIGPNGSGKSTLLNQLLAGQSQASGPTGKLYVDQVGFLPQRLDDLDDELSPLENLSLKVPTVPTGRIRNLLARLLLRGNSVERPLGTLSDGERFRVYLSALLLADPPAQLLILDEPTNNLDIDSVRQLCEALSGYRGALLVVSHDEHFLDQLGLDYYLNLSPEGALSKSYPIPPLRQV